MKPSWKPCLLRIFRGTLIIIIPHSCLASGPCLLISRIFHLKFHLLCFIFVTSFSLIWMTFPLIQLSVWTILTIFVRFFFVFNATTFSIICISASFVLIPVDSLGLLYPKTEFSSICSRLRLLSISPLPPHCINFRVCKGRLILYVVSYLTMQKWLKDSHDY